LVEVDEQISDLFLEDTEITTGHTISATHRAMIAHMVTPVFLGFASKNTTIQLLLSYPALPPSFQSPRHL